MRTIKSAIALILAVVISTMPAAAYDYPDVVAPGEVIGFPKSDFYNKKTGDIIAGDVKFSSSNFSIVKKTIKTGANLVKDIKINSRSEEVQIEFDNKAIGAAPNRNNVVITELAVKANRTLRDSNDYEIRSGTIFTFGEQLNFRVGLSVEEMEMSRDGVDIYLESGEKKYVRWVKGDSDGIVRVSYGDMAVGEGRVYSNDKSLYFYDASVDSNLEDENPNAYITGVNLGGGQFDTAPLRLQLLASRSDYIYEYKNGKLVAASGLKWDSDAAAWTVSLTQGRHFVISDAKLRAVPSGTTGGSSDNDGDSSDDTSSSTGSSTNSDNPYNNPETGSGSNIAVTISAIVAIVAITIVSVIMSTILSVKKK